MSTQPETGPHDGLTFIRAAACVLVVAAHCVECFYISTAGELIKEHGTAVGILGSAFRASVPLFVMVTGALLLPARASAGPFLARRLRRVLPPFILWSAAYAGALYLAGVYDGATCMRLLAMIPVQFSPFAGHLWYVYMLLGLYLLIPVISPWIERASDRELLGYLGLWGASLLLPYAHRMQPQLFGEAHWNAISTLYYFSGYVGYLLLGHYLARHRRDITSTRRRAAALVLMLAGYGTTLAGFFMTFSGAQSIPALELFWRFDTLNVAAMSAGLFELGLAVRGRGRAWFGIAARLSSASYAVYLAHIFVLYQLFWRWGRGHSPWAVIPLLDVSTLGLTFLLVILLARVPKLAAWIGAEGPKEARRMPG